MAFEKIMKYEERCDIKNRRELTAHGKMIKYSLIDKGMTQSQFCRRYNIRRQMFTDILYTERYPRVRRRIMKLLGLKEAA
ncbi:MAG: Rha family transcriptional regulator [Clostridia bacterium]|nr:Rha family transcriptional regulator [Clostridia bacterium]